MRSSYEYLEKHKLILVQWAGNLDIEEYKKSLLSFSEAIKNLDVQKVIHDIRNLDINLGYDDILELTIFRENKFNDFKVVYITEKPNQVVFSEYYSQLVPQKNAFHYCTTLRAALEILSVDLSEIELKSRLEALSSRLKE